MLLVYNNGLNKKKWKQVQIEIVGTYITSTENRANYYIPSFRISKENL